MCSEIDLFSSFLRRNMSGTKTTLLPLVKEEDDAKSLLVDNEEIASVMGSAAEEEGGGNTDDRKQAGKIKNEEDTDREETGSASASSEKELLEEDDDGFRTPTSLDHKIPAIIECPPAPKKPRPEPSRLKRKASLPSARELDATANIESIFRPTSSQDSAEEKQPKKGRSEDVLAP